MIDNGIIEETLDELIALFNADKKLFYKSYRTLPIELYREIERLSVSKSTLYSKLCKKAKLVTDNFHKNIV